MRNILITLLFAIVMLNANEETNNNERSALEEKADKQRNILKNKSKATTFKTYDEATGRDYSEPSTDPSKFKWNTKDFENHFKDSGLGDSVIGTSQQYIQSQDGSNDVLSNNPNQLRTDYLQDNDEYKDNKAINAWSSGLETSLITNTTKSGKTTHLKEDDRVQCYIARDIPIRYQCKRNVPQNQQSSGVTYGRATGGLIYGGEIGDDGIKAKTQCENECFEQYTCKQVKSEDTAKIEIKDGFDLTVTDDEKSKTKIFEVDYRVKLDHFSFYVNTSSNENRAYVSVKVEYWNGKIVDYYHKLKLSKDDREVKLSLKENIKKITVKIEGVENEQIITSKELTLVYFKDNKYICDFLQDITFNHSDQFAYVCPSGNTVDFTTETGSYKICADYGLTGDNIDGTFSTLESCSSVCKKNYTCEMNSNLFTTDMLQNFREGCIQGQDGLCEENTCKDLRLSGAKILHETIYDGNGNPTQTIVNSNLIEGVERPKFLLDEDVAFEKRNAEEWKDGAYKDMINKGTYEITEVNLDEDTEESHAYFLGLNEVDIVDGHINVPTRTLGWKYKPSSKFINKGLNHNFYAMIELIAVRYIYDQDGKKVKTKDKILYVKTQDRDSFKPFAIKKEYAQNQFVLNDLTEKLNYEETENEEARWEYLTFDESSKRWRGHSPTLLFENYKVKSMQLDKVYFQEFIINDLSKAVYLFPGLVRKRIIDGPFETLVYDGQFDGTGHAIAKYVMYAWDGKFENYTYEQIVAKLDNGELVPRYDNLSPDAHPKTLKNDNGKYESNIQIYTYGDIDKKSAFINVTPKEDDIGKKGYLFIFGY